MPSPVIQSRRMVDTIIVASKRIITTWCDIKDAYFMIFPRENERLIRWIGKTRKGDGPDTGVVLTTEYCDPFLKYPLWVIGLL